MKKWVIKMIKFKKDDEIKIIKKGDGGWNGVGLTGKIIRVDGDNDYLHYRVKYLDGRLNEGNNDYGWYNEESLELIASKRELKKGDRVKWKGTKTGTGDSSVKEVKKVFGIKKGKIYIIEQVKRSDFITLEGIKNDNYEPNFSENDLELCEDKLSKPNCIILWNGNYDIIYTKKERDYKIKELVDNKDVNNDNITIYDIRSESKISLEVDIEEIKEMKK